MIEWKKWKHVTKLDPDKPITAKDVAAIVDSGTDAIMLSGTLNITKQNVNDLMGLLKDYRIPKVLEPSGMDGLRDDTDLLFVPSVLNTDQSFWVLGAHKMWAEHFNVKWDKVIPEAYMVLNPRSSVAMLTKAKTDLPAKEVAAYAEVAERYFHFPVVYIEYSGTYGDPAVVKAVKDKLHDSILYYGGGINSGERAREMAKYADTIVVGNIAHDDIERFKETVVR